MKPPQTRTEKAHRLASVDAAWLLVWGCGAVLFGMAGVGAYLFAGDLRMPAAGIGLALPPPGDVRSTGSIDDDGRVAVEIYPSTGGQRAAEAMRRLRIEIEALRGEVAGLRRTLATLQDQDRQLPQRPGASQTGAAAAAAENHGDGADKVEPAADRRASLARVPAHASAGAAPAAEAASPVETLPAPETVPVPEATSEASKPATAVAVLPPEFSRPVRIVSFEGDDDPQTVGSIPASGAKAMPPARQDKPTAAAQPAGRIAPSDIERTDFAVDLGTYADRQAAATAWAGFRSDLDMLADLTPRLAARMGGDGPFRLLAGPFANAADAAAACVRLAGANVTCQPTVYS